MDEPNERRTAVVVGTGVIRARLANVQVGAGLGPLAGTFACAGAWYGSFAVATSDVESALDVGHAGFGAYAALLFATMAAAHIPGAALVERWGARPTLFLLVSVSGVLGIATSVSPGGAGLAVAMLVHGAAAGALNAVMNALAVARLDGRPGAFVRFHAWWNVGVLSGAGLTGGVIEAGGSFRWAWAAIGSATLVLAPAVARLRIPPSVQATPSPVRPASLLRAPAMRVLAALLLATTLVEAGLDVWGVLSLRERLTASAVQGAGAYAGGQVLAVVARAVLGPVVATAGARRACAVGAAAATAGLTIQAVASSPAAAGVGLALAVMGIAITGPLLLAHASAATARPAPTVAALTAVALVGGVLGPPLVGVVAGWLGLRAGLSVLAGVAALVAMVILLTPPDRSTKVS
ncbi:MAG: MFS transporter [Actinomycetota bacterium]|nr:MFS transporter [Actinomycetota bacterium]